MSTPSPSTRFSWPLLFVWVTPLLFLGWWFYITSPTVPVRTTPKLAFSTLLENHSGVLTSAGENLIYVHKQNPNTVLTLSALQEEASVHELLTTKRALTDAKVIAFDSKTEIFAWFEHTQTPTLFWQHAHTLKKLPAPCSIRQLQLLEQTLLALCTEGNLQQVHLSDNAPVFTPLLQEQSARAIALEADRLWLLSSSHLKTYQWPSLELLAQSAIPQGVDSFALWQQGAVLSKGNSLYQQQGDEWHVLWKSQGRIATLLSVAGQEHEKHHSFFYHEVDAQSDIWLLPTRQTTAKLRLGSRQAEWSGIQNATGTLAYLSQGASADEVWLRPKEQNPYRLATLPDGSQATHLQWSSEGPWLWLTTPHTLYRLSTQTQQLQPLWQTPTPIEQFALLSDTQAVILSQEQLSLLDLKSAELTPLSGLETMTIKHLQGVAGELYVQASPKADQTTSTLFKLTDSGFVQELELPASTTHWWLTPDSLWLEERSNEADNASMGTLSERSRKTKEILHQQALPEGFQGQWTLGVDGVWFSKQSPALGRVYKLSLDDESSVQTP